MKNLKTVFLLLLTVLITGCAVNPLESNSNKPLLISADPIESFDEESRIYINGENTSSQPENTNSNSFVSLPPEESLHEEVSNGSFLVKEKKYVYCEKDLVLLDVTNETDTNYTVTIIGKYLDKNGNVIETEKQSFEGFAANYKTYFLLCRK